ncbi:hypothetical protein GC173_15410 [bacterium]|nr:hypothetical protein [bacterium]
MKVRFMGMEPGTGKPGGPSGPVLEGPDAEAILRQLQQNDFFLADAPFEEYLAKLSHRTGVPNGAAEEVLNGLVKIGLVVRG